MLHDAIFIHCMQENFGYKKLENLVNYSNSPTVFAEISVSSYLVNHHMSLAHVTTLLKVNNAALSSIVCRS